MDEANYIVPLAHALVDEESKDIWSWFLQKLLEHVIKDCSNIYLIFDRYAGIKSAVEGENVVWSRG